MSDDVAISVIIPIYNAEVFLNETIDSVLTQTFSDFELLALDDSSTDHTPDIIQSYKDSRIRYIQCPHDFIGTLNYGLSLTRGKYVAQIDHDDIMLPFRLQTQFDFMESNKDVAACGGFMTTFGRNDAVLQSPLEYKDIILEFLKRSTGPIYNSTGFIRRNIFTDYNVRYKYGYSFAADTKFWTDIIRVGKVVNLPTSLTLYRTYDKQTSVKTYSESSKAADVIRRELVDFLFSKINGDEKLKCEMNETLLPLLSKMTDMSFFSSKGYSDFLAEIIEGLHNNGFINLNKPLDSNEPW